MCVPVVLQKGVCENVASSSGHLDSKGCSQPLTVKKGEKRLSPRSSEDIEELDIHRDAVA